MAEKFRGAPPKGPVSNPPSQQLQIKFQEAVALHQAGRLLEAQNAYREILQLDPKHFDSLHLSGVAAMQAGQFEEGIRLIDKAIAVNPFVAPAHNNRGNALFELNKLNEALDSYDKAVELKPDYADAYNNRGNALMELRRLDEALASYDRAVALIPNYLNAHYNRGKALRDLKRLDEALASYDKVLSFVPGDAELHNNRGVVLFELNRPAEASVSFYKASLLQQDRTFPGDFYDSKKIMVVFAPEYATMSGGIFSIFSIANQMRELKAHHGYDVLVMTLPNPGRLTYLRNLNFKNSENVYRIAQLSLCKAAQEVYLHIPEYASASFVENLTSEELGYLRTREKLHVNLLNQNIQLMPTKESFENLRQLSGNISQSVAHHAYFTQEIADKYDLPTLLLPAFTDLSSYAPCDFNEKEKLIIYSHDDAPYKEACLQRLRRELPDYTMMEIRDITFDKFMEYATRCLFSITFGEGFDGYLAQPIHQGGIGFAVFNEEFFPSPHFKNYYNIFSSGDAMVAEICDRIRKLADDRAAYVELNGQFRKEYEKLYSYEDYVEQLKKLSLREFEILPSEVK